MSGQVKILRQGTFNKLLLVTPMNWQVEKLSKVTGCRSSLNGLLRGVPNNKFCLEIPDWCPCCIEKFKMESRCSKSLKLRQQQLSKDVTVERKGEQSNVRFISDTMIEDLESFKVGYWPVNIVKNVTRHAQINHVSAKIADFLSLLYYNLININTS